ncbi:nickel-dependent hydrogenase large subunit [Halochromatium sp.]
MSDLGGQLQIRLETCSGAVVIGSSRPLTAARVFSGKSPAEVVRQLPTLFSLCGTAQAAACVSACEKAVGCRPSAGVLARRQALVQAESIKEHLWRLLLDWPRMLEPLLAREGVAEPRRLGHPSAVPPTMLPPMARAMPQVMRAFNRLHQAQRAVGDPFALDPAEAESGARASLDLGVLPALAVEQALDMRAAEWVARIDSVSVFQRWAQEGKTPAAALVRALLSRRLAASGANQVARLPSVSAGAYLELERGSGRVTASNARAHGEGIGGSEDRDMLDQQRSEVLLEQLGERLAAADAEAFIAAPRWRQQCAETGPLARVAGHPLVLGLLDEYGNGLLTRLAALLLDLALSASRLEALAASTPIAPGEVSPSFATCQIDDNDVPSGADTDVQMHPCVGIGSADAARGLLLHRVVLVDGRVEQYQILAPTEWNFHPEGVVAQGLAAIARSGAVGPELEHLARLYITAVDPCVEYRLSVS